MKYTKKDMLNFRSHYNKAIKVINSCETYNQVLNAERFINNLTNIHSSKEGPYITFHNHAYVDYINYLLKKVNEKKSELS